MSTNCGNQFAAGDHRYRFMGYHPIESNLEKQTKIVTNLFPTQRDNAQGEIGVQEHVKSLKDC